MLVTPRGADASVARRAGTLAAPILALLFAALLVPVARQGAPPLPEAQHGSAAVPLGASGLVARTLARDDPRFSVRHLTGGFTTAGGGVTARFTRRGVLINAGGLSWSPGLRSFGRGEHLTAVAAASPRGHANQVRYHRGGVEEWYANTRLGLEQGFTLYTRPPGTAPVTLAIGELSLGVSAQVDGDRRGASLTREGRVLIRYTGLLVSDSRGHPLHAWIEASGRHLRLRLDDRGARYRCASTPSSRRPS
jgi:hypothetical protein